MTPVTFTVTAVDGLGQPLTVNCTPSSGSGFFKGTTPVSCSATDASGQVGSCPFDVTVVDTRPPEVNCPADKTATATGPGGATVTYSASCSDACGIGPFDCAPNSGSTFPIGMTTVTCTCEDAEENSAACSFKVTTEEAPPNECPTADPLDVSVAQNASVNFQLTGSDPDGDPIQFAVTQPAAHGVVVLQIQTGAASYTPTPGYCGPDSFKYRVSDGQCTSAEATVTITVACPPPLLGCRVTGGALTTSGETDPNLIFETQTAMGAGQVGASCGAVGCFDEAGHIQGVWQHSLKKRKANFRSRNLTSLACSCMDGTTGATAFGAPCNPDDPSGPEPRPAPANVACFAGTGLYKRTIPAAFRVEVEDHGEPGANGTAPVDKYRIRIWIPQGQETIDALAQGACCCNPSPTGQASRKPNIDDGTNIIHGNIQIHPQTPAEHEECPVPDSGCRICGNGVVDGSEECDPPDSTCRGGTNPVTGVKTDFRCTADCTCPDPVCGDGFVDPGEECDAPDSLCGNGHTCLEDCTCAPPRCGDRVLDPGEQCDDGNSLACDGCSPTCRTEGCGDGVVCAAAGEECDPPEEDSPGCPFARECRSDCTCTPPRCGDGILDPGEDCEPPESSCPFATTCTDNCECPLPVCGDNICNGSEDGTTCCQDCGGCACFDEGGLCCVGETCATPGICKGALCYPCACDEQCDPVPCPGTCGDGTCNSPGENAVNCAVDCGCAATADACTPGSQAPNNGCGCDCDAVLDDFACPDLESVCGYGGNCGDGKCATGCENSTNCTADCPKCGDGSCVAADGENPCTCPDDCSNDPNACESCECSNHGGSGTSQGNCACKIDAGLSGCPNNCSVCGPCE
ncbi:MAG: Ig-like domain-containing protein [Candidatus Binatia bacterium]